MTPQTDILFAGAGLAALSLAARLAALPRPPRMLLVDPRDGCARDRTWCHWRLHEDPFASAITHRWDRWTVRHRGQSVTVRHAEAPYVRIPSDLFHEVAHAQLSRCPQVEFLRGVSVASLEDRGDHAVCLLSDGRRLRASWVFDSRPPGGREAPWRQVFRGLELTAAGAGLDVRRATLMDFRAAGPGGARFFYVLPLDAETALVEDTRLVPAGTRTAFADAEILAYANENLRAAGWEIRHREEGDLPMGLPMSPAVRGRIIPWGTPAGAVRPSSGYAYSRIQQASERMAVAWRENGHPAAVAHGPRLLTWMDRVFLRAMSRHPVRVPDFFVRLFRRVPAAPLVRFLESEPSTADIFRVIRALPPAPFLDAALR